MSLSPIRHERVFFRIPRLFALYADWKGNRNPWTLHIEFENGGMEVYWWKLRAVVSGDGGA
jgi:hypothetical protein